MVRSLFRSLFRPAGDALAVWLKGLVPPQGSYHCGTCKTGFTGDQVKGCKPEISCGNSLTNPCDVNAQCIPERDGSVTCQVSLPVSCFLLKPWSLRVDQGLLSPKCGIGWAGNGYLCGKDTDIDGYPDEKLKCKDPNCKKVRRPQGQRGRRAFSAVRFNLLDLLLRTTASTSQTLVKRTLTGTGRETPVMRTPMETVYRTSRSVDPGTYVNQTENQL